MSKNTLINIFVILFTGIIIYYIQTLIFTDLRFELQNVYLFFALATTIIYVSLTLLSKTPKFKDQLGFIYFATIFMKMGIFFAVFDSTIMSINAMTNTEALSLLLPIFIFLFLEVYFIAKILNKTTQKT